MTKQQLFYESVVPVSLERHKNLSIEQSDYEFARLVNSVPLTAVEILPASQDYTIVFAGTESAVIPVAVLGVEDNDNLYINPNGQWSVNYIPAFVRRYPFVFSRSEDGKTFTLCIDENCGGCNQNGRGERLFDDQGERTAYLSNMLGFLEQYQAHFQRTQLYCSKLKELDLLEPMKADFTFPNGEQKTLSGFVAVNREKLKQLPPEKLAELVKTDELELTYNHLRSLGNFTKMVERASQRLNDQAAPTQDSSESIGSPR